MKKISIIGHFGFGLDLANGQTIKTKIIYDELLKTYNDIFTVDAHGGLKAIVPVIIGCTSSIMKCKNIILMLTENGLKVSVPVLAIINKIYNRKLHYIVIGGWLPEFLKKQKILSKLLKKFDYIYVETTTMKKTLEKQGFKNIVVMPNCKDLKILSESELVYNRQEPLKLCTFSRVMKEKGIEEAIEVVKTINEEKGRKVFTLDIYGQIDKEQISWFEELRTELPNYITYGGIVPFDDSVKVLKNYYALLFPTYYDGEGFAGTIIDAYAAGLPVVASDWKYNYEVVDDYKTGLLYSDRNIDEFKTKLYWIYTNQQEWNRMKKNCINKSRKFLTRIVIEILDKRLI